MNKSNRAGFTIVETMLVLAITGLLIVGVLVGTGSALSRQRYNDSVYSLQSYIQSQYSSVANVYSEGAVSASCTGSRGQSDCVVLGKYITTNQLAGRTSELVSRTVVGKIPTGSISSLTDITIFNTTGYDITLLNESTTYNIEWESLAVSPISGNPMNFSILILRSPRNGYIKTFINPTTSLSNVKTMLTAGNLTNPLKICVNNYDRTLSASNRRAVYVNSNSSSSSGVELLNESASGC